MMTKWNRMLAVAVAAVVVIDDGSHCRGRRSIDCCGLMRNSPIVVDDDPVSGAVVVSLVVDDYCSIDRRHFLLHSFLSGIVVAVAAVLDNSRIVDMCHPCCAH